VSEISDNDLVANIRDGNTESFSIIVERYQSPVYNLMYRYSGSDTDAADMTQELFCRAFERLDRYHHGKSFFAWLYTLALNQARDWVRKRKREGLNLRRLAADAPIVNTRSAEQLADERDSYRGLESALAALPEDRRELVLLRYRHDRSIGEIAEIFEISRSAVKMRLQRALQELAKQLK